MFTSLYFNPEYFNEYFKIAGKVISLPGGGGGGVEVNQAELGALGLNHEDEEILAFIVAFVLTR